MFTDAQFDKLHSIWDGKAENISVCNSCGACCHNEEKMLYPGEYDYLVRKTGQHNSLWCSQGCLCMQIKDKVKPIICKSYPIKPFVDLQGNLTFDEQHRWDDISANCSALQYSDESIKQAKAFFKFLFTDVDNRLWHILNYSHDHFIELEEQRVKDLGGEVAAQELYTRGLLAACGINPQQFHKY